jgi:chemotaxis signal transduction protein
MSSFEQWKRDIYTPLPGLNIQDLERMKEEDFWEYVRQRAHAVSEPPSHAEYLECKLSNKACLIALRDLAEVLPPPHRLARLPEMPAWMVGIMAWRSETIAVVNLDLYLLSGQEAAIPQPTEGMLLIASQPGQALGLLVPAIGFTSTIELEQIVPLPVATKSMLAEETGIIAGIYTDLPILNIPRLLAGLIQQIRTTADHG